MANTPVFSEYVVLGGPPNRPANKVASPSPKRVDVYKRQARALAKSPKLLLCDEPTGALDYNTGKNILKLLQDTCLQMGMTVVVITHNQALKPMADRVIEIKNSKVVGTSLNPHPTPVEQIEW